MVFGRASGFGTKVDLYALDGNNGFRMSAADNFGHAGNSVSSAGDVNGDGYGDIVVGARDGDATYVVFGKASGFTAGLKLSSLDGSNGFCVKGAGVTVAGGDVNGDGFADLVVAGEHESGSTFVAFGHAAPFDAALSVSSLDGSNGFRIASSAHVQAPFGQVATADVNGDGFDDVLLTGFKNIARDRGIVVQYQTFVVFGDDAGIPATVKLSALDGHNGFRFDAGKAMFFPDNFNIASAGDLNGDGIEDIVMGGSISGLNHQGEMMTHPFGSVVFGSAAGFDAHFNANALDGSNGFKIVPAGDYFRSVSSAGDFNGDGYDDLLINEGETVSVVFGRPDGFSTTLDLSSIDGNNGFQVQVIDGADSAAAAGDVNGDGFDDLIVGESGASDNSGTSYVVFGHRPGDATTVVGSGLDTTIHGSNFADTLSGNGGNDTLVGYSGDDVLDGGSESDLLDGADGRDVLLGGEGDDTLDGGSNADTLNGGDGADTFVFRDNHGSPTLWYDTVVGADFAVDKWDTYSSVKAVQAPVTHGQLSAATFQDDLFDALHGVKAGEAALFTPDSGDLAGETFLFINNHGAASWGWSLVVHLVDPVNTASLDVSDFI